MVTFAHSNLFVEKKPLNDNSGIKTTFYKYNYIPKNEYCNNKEDSFWLRHSNFDDFDKLFDNEETLSFYVNKSFLKKNKSMILTKEKMDDIGFCNTRTLLLKAKYLFLIDIEESVENKILIKLVSFQEESSCDFEEIEINRIQN